MDRVKEIFYKNLPPSWIAFLYIYFNKIFEEERVSQNWGQLQMCMLFKKGVLSDSSNYRPITLVNVIIKFFTQILTDRIAQ